MKPMLTRLVQLFPRAFREQFGREMTEHIDAEYAEARARGGLARRASNVDPIESLRSE